MSLSKTQVSNWTCRIIFHHWGERQQKIQTQNWIILFSIFLTFLVVLDGKRFRFCLLSTKWKKEQERRKEEILGRVILQSVKIKLDFEGMVCLNVDITMCRYVMCLLIRSSPSASFWEMLFHSFSLNTKWFDKYFCLSFLLPEKMWWSSSRIYASYAFRKMSGFIWQARRLAGKK